MERYTMFLDWKNQYYENNHTTQSNLQIQYNSYQITNGVIHRTRTKKFHNSYGNTKDPKQPKHYWERRMELEESTFLLLLLSHFSRVRLCATPWMAAHWAPPSLGFSRQEHWSGLPFPSPMHENEKWKWSCSSRVQLVATPWTTVYRAPPSMGFSRREYWSGVPLPSPHRSYACF